MKKIIMLLFVVFSIVFVTSQSYAETSKNNKQIQAKSSKDKSSIQFDNSYFYDKKGKFLEEKGKDAIIALLEYHGYPMFEGIREQIFVMDYNSGKFAECGLSGLMYENNKTNLYMLLDIFLLPNQMLAEHWHVDGEVAAKREGWLTRWGMSYVVGIGEDNMKDFPQVKVPDVHWDGKVVAKHVMESYPGTFINLAQVLSRHWQLAGQEGAIITEVANYAEGEAVKRSDPKMN